MYTVVNHFFVYGFLVLLTCILLDPKETLRACQHVLQALQRLSQAEIERERNEKRESKIISSG
jgi:hypothetical protein